VTCERTRRENCEQNIARLQAINCSERATGLLNTIQSVSQAVQTLLTETSTPDLNTPAAYLLHTWCIKMLRMTGMSHTWRHWTISWISSIERIESKQNLRVPRAISTDFRTSGLSLSSSQCQRMRSLAAKGTRTGDSCMSVAKDSTVGLRTHTHRYT
jgi:hypothetical protein